MMKKVRMMFALAMLSAFSLTAIGQDTTGDEEPWPDEQGGGGSNDDCIIYHNVRYIPFPDVCDITGGSGCTFIDYRHCNL